MDTGQPTDLADLNWRRLAPLRQAVDRELRAMGRAAGPLRSDVRHGAANAADAWLFAGWLMSRRDGRRHLDIVTSVDRTGADDERWSVSIARGNDVILAAEIHGRQIGMVPVALGRPFNLVLPMEQLAEEVATELRALGRDTGLTAAIRAAHARFTSAA